MRTVVGLGLFIGGPVLVAIALHGRRRTAMAAMVVLAVGALAYVIGVEDRRLGSIGWTAPERDDVRPAVVALFGGLAMFGALGALLPRADDAGRVLGARRHISLVERVGGALVAGVTEEVLFRGYAIERLGDELDSLGVAAAFVVVVFVLCHVPAWGIGPSIQIGGPGAALAWLYVSTRNLPVCIAVHVVNDLWAFVAVPRVLARRQAATRQH